MARITKTRKPQASPETLLESLMLDHLRTLAVQNYSVHTVRNRQVHIGFFLQWCKERGLTAVSYTHLDVYKRQGEAVPGQPTGANKSAAASVQRAPDLAPRCV